MTDCKYWNVSWGKSFAGRCSAPDDIKTNASNNKWCTSPQTCTYLLNQSYEDKSQMTTCNYSERTKIQRKEIQKQIEELQTALKLLEIEENRKTPCEKAYRDAYGEFPITDSMSGGDKDYIAWDAFQKGYNAAYKEPEDTVWKSVALRFGEKLSDIGPCGYYEFSPDEWFEWVVNTYEKLSDDVVNLLKKEKQAKKLQEKEKVMGNLKTSLQELANGNVRPIDDVMEEVRTLQEKEWTYKVTDEKGEDNPYKQYLNSVKNLQEKNWYVDAKSLVKPKTLYSLIGEFLNEIDYMYNTESEREHFLEKFEEWLPKPIDETCGLNENDADWNRGYNTYREYLMMQLK